MELVGGVYSYHCCSIAKPFQLVQSKAGVRGTFDIFNSLPPLTATVTVSPKPAAADAIAAKQRVPFALQPVSKKGKVRLLCCMRILCLFLAGEKAQGGPRAGHRPSAGDPGSSDSKMAWQTGLCHG